MDQKGFNNKDGWYTAEFEQYYTRVLMEEQQLEYCTKLKTSMEEVYIPCPCSKFMYTYSRPDLKRGVILHLLFSFLFAVVDTLTILIPCISFNSNRNPDTSQVVMTLINILLRVILCLWFIGRYPRSNLTLMTFPLLSVISVFTYGIRVYELLYLGDNKEYDSYRYFRTWMWGALVNIPFSVASLIMVVGGAPGLDSIVTLLFVLNFLNVVRCFLTSWASVESGNDLHSDFGMTIKRYHL